MPSGTVARPKPLFWSNCYFNFFGGWVGGATKYLGIHHRKYFTIRKIILLYRYDV